MTTDLMDIMVMIADWIVDIIPIAIGIIMLVIFWNLAQFVLKAGDDAEREKYKKFMIWSVIAVFLLISFWGIVGLLVNSFFGSTSNPMLGNPTYVDKDGNPL